MRNTEPVFHFALPRLIARLGGGSDFPAEMSWLEANVVGGLVHGVAYLFAAHFFWRDLTLWQQLLLLIPLAILLWLGWLIALYINSLVIRLLRAVGMLRRMPDQHAQSLLIGVMTTGFAIELWRTDGWFRFAGGLWIAAVSVNLVAAMTLALLPRNGTATQ